jgi:hypothetical protein
MTLSRTLVADRPGTVVGNLCAAFERYNIRAMLLPFRRVRGSAAFPGHQMICRALKLVFRRQMFFIQTLAIDTPDFIINCA